MAAPPSNHRDSVRLTVSKTCRVQEEVHTVGHSEATSSATHPKSPQKLCLPPPHPPSVSLYFLALHASSISQHYKVTRSTRLAHASSFVYFLNGPQSFKETPRGRKKINQDKYTVKCVPWGQRKTTYRKSTATSASANRGIHRNACVYAFVCVCVLIWWTNCTNSS